MNTRYFFATSLALSLVSLSACSSGDGGASTGNSAGAGGGSDSSSSGSGDAGTKPEPISLSGYDRSCTSDTDCVLATRGDVCNLCLCPDGAINAKDTGRYEGDVSEAKKLCPPNTGEVVCEPCEMKKPVCQLGVCAAVSVE